MNVEYHREWRRKNPDKVRAAAARYRSKPEYREIYQRRYQQNREASCAAQRERYTRNPEPFKQANIRSQRKLKQEVINAYGGKCACCGIIELDFLTIDHKNNDGGSDRKKGLVGAKMYLWLKRNGFPKGYQPLCWNCNVTKGLFGSCPHQRISTLTVP